MFLDEFQDTTAIQYAFVKECFWNSGTKVTSVGDNKQRIMVWAGAVKTIFVALSRAKASVTFTFCKKRSGMKCPMQRHNAINEFFDLLQRPGIAEVKRFQNR